MGSLCPALVFFTSTLRTRVNTSVRHVHFGFSFRSFLCGCSGKSRHRTFGGGGALLYNQLPKRRKKVSDSSRGIGETLLYNKLPSWRKKVFGKLVSRVFVPLSEGDYTNVLMYSCKI